MTPVTIALAATKGGLPHRDSLLNVFSELGILTSRVAILSDSPEFELSRFVRQGSPVPLVVVIGDEDTRVTPGSVHANLLPPLSAALEAAVDLSGSLVAVVHISESPIPLRLNRDFSSLVTTESIPSDQLQNAQALQKTQVIAELEKTAREDERGRIATALQPSADGGVPQPAKNNVPPATYLRYIPRTALSLVEDSLTQAQPVTCIVGLGGVGKSSLAREVANRSVTRQNDLNYEVVVWISDKSNPGSTTLSTLLDQIAETADFPGLRSMPLQDKAGRARALLQAAPTLVVVDNLESVSDSDLISWIKAIPHPSRVLVTTRESFPALEDVQRSVPLVGFDIDSTVRFVQQAAEKLGIDATVSNADLRTLWKLTAGNAKAIEVSVGLIAAGEHSTEEIFRALANGTDQLFTDLFVRCWGSLDERARRVMYVVDLLPYGVTAEALAIIVQGRTGGMSEVVRRLRRLSLLDMSTIRDPQRAQQVSLFTMNSLVQAFVRSQRQTDPEWETVRAATVRHIGLLVSQVGFCPDDVDRLHILDRPHLLKNVESVIATCVEGGLDHEVVALTRDVRYYYYVRGIWSPDPNPNLQRAAAARRLGMDDEERDALLYFCNIAAKQEILDQEGPQFARLRELMLGVQEDSLAAWEFQHVTALAALAEGRTDEAIRLWEENIGGGTLPPALESANMRWLGVAYFRSGRIAKAREQFERAIVHDRDAGFGRAVLASELYLVRILLRPSNPETEPEDLSSARSELLRLGTVIEAMGDELYHAEWLELSGRLVLADDRAQGVGLLEGAMEGYDRLGLLRRRDEVAAAIAVAAT